METALRRLDGVDRITISIAQQKFELTYKPGASFRPAEIRSAVGKAGVKVLRFRISARGRIQEEAGKRFFLAGEEKFLLSDAPKIPDGSLSIEAIVDDAGTPLQLKVVKFNATKQQPHAVNAGARAGG
jgi:hypothetical protein